MAQRGVKTLAQKLSQIATYLVISQIRGNMCVCVCVV
jgi:hypothetical protein